MKKIFLIVTVLTLCMTFSYGQTASDSILMKKVFGGYQFIQGEQKLTIKKLGEALQSNQLAYEQFKSAKSNYTLATVIGTAGGFMVGWPLGTAIAGGEPNWTLAGIGAGLIVVSIPISSGFNKKAKQAVDLYNVGLYGTSFWERTESRFTVTSNGIGLTLNF